MIESETSGDLKRGLLAIVRCVRSRPTFFAEQLRKSMKVGPTSCIRLASLVASRVLVRKNQR